MIYLGADHAGFVLKEDIKKYLTSRKILWDDLGAWTYNKNDDYPDYAKKVAQKVAGAQDKGILVCGSGVGVCIAANKVKGIRAVVANSLDTARMSRKHLDTNILCFGSWQVSLPRARKILDVWLHTSFSRAQRHRRRVQKLSA